MKGCYQARIIRISGLLTRLKGGKTAAGLLRRRLLGNDVLYDTSRNKGNKSVNSVQENF